MPFTQGVNSYSRGVSKMWVISEGRSSDHTSESSKQNSELQRDHPASQLQSTSAYQLQSTSIGSRCYVHHCLSHNRYKHIQWDRYFFCLIFFAFYFGGYGYTLRMKTLVSIRNLMEAVGRRSISMYHVFLIRINSNS
jgi:hypothetical protein